MANEVEGTEEVDGQVTIKDSKAVLAALQRAKDDAKKYREQFEAKEKEVTTLNEKVSSLEGDDGVAKWKKQAVSVAAKAALANAGVSQPDRVFGFMDLEKVTLSDDGKLEGFDESIKSVKEKLPELFDNKRRVGGQANLNDKGDVKTTKSATEMQVDSMLGT